MAKPDPMLVRLSIIQAIQRTRDFACICGSILDVSRAVELTFTDDTEDRIVFNRVFCGRCFDRLPPLAELVEGVVADTGHEVSFEALDGRTL